MRSTTSSRPCRRCPVRRIFVWFAVSVVFSAIAISNVAKALAPEPLTRASDALRGSIESIISVDTNGLIDATEQVRRGERRSPR